MMNYLKLNDLAIKASDKDFYDCIVSLPWYGAVVDVYVYFEKDEGVSVPTPKQLQALKELLDESPKIFRKLEEQLFHYYQEQREENKYEDYYKEFFPEISSPKELEKYMYFRSIKVSYYDDDWSKFIGFIIDCDWDKQLGIGVKLIKNRVREISVQDIVL